MSINEHLIWRTSKCPALQISAHNGDASKQCQLLAAVSNRSIIVFSENTASQLACIISIFAQ